MKDQFNDEHVFPEGIGGYLIIKRVCVTCNSRLGSEVDHLLTNHFLMELFRDHYGIRGKNAKVPQVFTHGTLSEDPNQKVHILTNHEGEFDRIHLVTRKESLDEGKVRFTGDGSNEKSLLESTNKVLSRNNLPEMTTEEFQETKQTEMLGPQIEVEIEKEIDHFQYIRAIAKIAYELAWIRLGDSYLEDPQAAVIREFILNGTPETPYSFIKFAGITQEEVKSELEPSMHQGVLQITPSSINCLVFISDVFYGDFVMSLTPSLYSTGFTTATVVNDVLTGESHWEDMND